MSNLVDRKSGGIIAHKFVETVFVYFFGIFPLDSMMDVAILNKYMFINHKSLNKNCRLFFILFLLLACYSTGALPAQPSPTDSATNSKEAEKAYYDELVQQYVPQKTPKESYQLELQLVAQGIYCYDLPLFDPQWRKKGHHILSSPDFQESAKAFNKPFKVSEDGKYAVIYFPQDNHLAPIFLYKEGNGWIIDRSTVEDKIRYNEDLLWVVIENESPYLTMLQKIYRFKKVVIDAHGVIGYEVEALLK